jgi:Protein of unknown function (DUF2742)
VHSRQVAYLPVYELLSPLLGDPALIPGTPVWCQLDGTDPAKWQAVLWAAVWWAIAEDARQAAKVDASKAVASSENWGAVARSVRSRSGVYIPRDGGRVA